MMRRIQKRVDLGDGHALFCFSRLYDFVARANFAFLDNAEVEAGTVTRGQERRHKRLIGPNANAVTGNSRLSDFEERAPDPIPVADAHHVIGQSFDGEILAVLSGLLQVAQVGPVQVLLPVAIGLGLIHEDGSLHAPVPGEIALTVSVKIQPSDPTTAGYWTLPDPGVHGSALPLDVAWEADVH
jgi:hypothetical protein